MPEWQPGDRVQLTMTTGEVYPGTVAAPPEKGPGGLTWVRWDDGWESWAFEEVLEAIPRQ